MNVKPGDVAIIIKGRWPNVGRIVQVEREWGEVDYTHMGYGVQHCWLVESLGGSLECESGACQRGFTPDISLRPLPDITPEQVQEIRKRHVREQFNQALRDLAVILERESEALVGH